MFVAPHRHPTRIWLEVRDEGGNWRTVYLRGQAGHRWRSRQLDHIRFRSALFSYFWSKHPRAFEQLLRWLADRAAEDFPDAVEFRVRLETFRSPSPAEVRNNERPTSRFTFTRSFPLEADR